MSRTNEFNLIGDGVGGWGTELIKDELVKRDQQ